MGTRKKGRARGRHACLPRARPFSLSPTTSKRLLRRLIISLRESFLLVGVTIKHARAAPEGRRECEGGFAPRSQKRTCSIYILLLTSSLVNNALNQAFPHSITLGKIGTSFGCSEFWDRLNDCGQALVSLAAVFWISRNAPPKGKREGERCVTSKKRLRRRLAFVMMDIWSMVFK